MSALRLMRMPFLMHSAAAAAAAAPAAALAGSRCATTLSSVIATEVGKTTLQGYLPHAFLVNNVQVEGPILCLPESWLLWDVRTFSDITPSSLAILGLIDPPPEVLVVGCGATMRPLPQELQQFLRQRNIATEVLDTRNALSYFNFLNDEGRPVVGALLPAGMGAAPASSSP